MSKITANKSVEGARALENKGAEGVDELERRLELDRLFEAYGPMLTARQASVMEQYLAMDYSAVEIAENLDISRQAVHDTIKKTEALLKKMERKLGFYKKTEKLEGVLEKIRQYALDREDMKLYDLACAGVKKPSGPEKN